jgi:PAS domain S-box-containing protein
MPPPVDDPGGDPLGRFPETIRQLFSELPAAVAIFDRAMRYVAYSRAYATIFGATGRDLTGLCHYDVFPDAKPEWRANNDRCLAGESLRCDEEQWIRADGSVEWVRWQLHPLRDPANNVIGIMLFAEDITDRKRAEEEIRRSEERFRGLVETTDDFVWETDSTLVYTYASPRVRDLLGYSPEEMVGRTPFDFMDAAEGRRVAGLISDAIASRAPFRSVENVNRRRDGAEIVLETSGVPFFDAAGDWRGYRGIDRDISARRHAEDERTRLLASEREARDAAQGLASQMTALLASLTEGVLVFDRGGRVVVINDATRRMLDIAPDQPVKRLPDMCRESKRMRLYDEREHELPPKQWPGQRALRGETFESQQLSHICRDGRRCYLLASGTSVRDSRGQVELGLVVFRDVTRLREYEQSREDFIRMTSHDLRNPLAVITGQSEWLRRLLEKQGLTREASSADSIHRGSRRMNSMIQDLVDSFRLESGRFELNVRPTNLLDAIQDIAARVGTIADRARISVECPTLVRPALVDPDRIERVIVNLLTNALKYSPPDAPVVIRLSTEGDEAVISV